MASLPRVFLSYSHDSPVHRARVLALSERLRADGIETVLDQYVNGTPQEGWPRWMLNQLDQADHCLLICTATYYRRFRGHEAPDKGKGVDWEGALITQALYDARSATIRFVPVFFEPSDQAWVPEPVRSQTLYCLDSKQSYQNLHDFLLGQAGIEPGPVGVPKRKPRQRAAPLNWSETARNTRNTMNTPPTSSHGPSSNAEPSPRADSHCDVLLLYVNEKERQAIVEAFRGPRGGLPRPSRVCDLPCLDLGRIDGRRILAMGTNMGSATAGGSATVTLDAINKLNPEWLIAVGIAFGMDPSKIPLGTLLVSDRVSCYEFQRVGRKIIRRGDTVSVHPYLKQHFQTVSSPPYWSGAPVHFGEILSGEKLIDEPGFKGKLCQAYPEALGGEMEAAGIYSAAMLKHRAWIIVKAVCDFADGHKGEDKEARQAEAARNAAQFVRHCLSVYVSKGTTRVRTPKPGRHKTPAPPPPPEPNPIRPDAVAAIAETLGLFSSLRQALSQHMTGHPGAAAHTLAEGLCAQDADAFQQALGHFRDALGDLKNLVRQGRGEGARLREGATEILGWMMITTVLDPYDQETAPAVRAWKQGAALHIPFERSHSVEVLIARWLKRKARFDGKRRLSSTGEDDLADKPLSELGFNRPFERDPRLLLDEIWKRIHQKLRPGESVHEVTQEMRTRIGTRMARKRHDKTDPRWFRLVIDRREVHQSVYSPGVLQAIAQEIPLLQLLVIGDIQDSCGIFLYPPGELAAEIDEALEKIDSLQ